MFLKSQCFSNNKYVSFCFTALYLTLVATIAAYIGQKIIDKLINIFQRASLIIFVLSFTIFVSAIALGEWLCDPDSVQSELHAVRQSKNPGPSGF